MFKKKLGPTLNHNFEIRISTNLETWCEFVMINSKGQGLKMKHLHIINASFAFAKEKMSEEDGYLVIS